MLIEDSLNFKAHVKGVIKNVAHKVALLGKIRPKLTEHAAIMVYKSMVLPLFDNGDIFYMSANQTLLGRLDVFQNSAVGTIFRMDPRENTKKNMEKLRIMPLGSRRLLHLMEHTRWISKTGLHADNRVLSTRAHSTHRCNLVVHRPRTTLYQRSFVYRGCKIWNTLPSDLHTQKEAKVYKICIKDLICKNKLNCDML